ncbi:MAG: hypothetical protein CVV13_11630 [Gammaproteobacteria bacterium HGW-Gammaproteobacteria-3]|nr:MAG: hypothetical protein CVV13_11630 [Gammaproteobacteria bacterium HGW-Gammaproteobacteria-3]
MNSKIERLAGKGQNTGCHAVVCSSGKESEIFTILFDGNLPKLLDFLAILTFFQSFALHSQAILSGA